MSFTATFFVDYQAKVKHQRTVTLEELADWIRTATAPRKEDLPWLKLARFGNATTPKGSLRWDRNVIGETGIEGDYDGEVVPFETAVEKVEKEGLRAIVYTSPSYTPEKPRWRILCPYSKELPGARRRMLGRVNGLLGGILQSESWTLSQSYYYGSVDNNPNHKVVIVDGQSIDELDEIAIGKPGTKPGTNGIGPATQGNGRVDELSLLQEIRTGASYHTAAMRLLGVWALHGTPMLEARARIVSAFEDVFPADRDGRWRARVAEIPRLLEFVYGKEADKSRGGARERKPNGHGADKEQPTGRVHIINGATVMPERIDWIWGGWLARRKLHVLAGSKGDGKTTIALSLTAAFTTGGTLPDGSHAPRGDVLMWSGEDDLADSLLPRLIICGGDPARFHYVKGTQDDGKERPFDPSRDFPSLIETARGLPPLVLVIVDPIVSAVAGDSHKNAEVRRGLQPFVDLTSELNCAGLGNTHFTKNTAGRNPVDRITGSLAFGALPRVLFGTAKPPDAERKRRLVRVASNIGPDGGGFEYDLARALLPQHDFEAQFVRWGMQLDGDARTLLNEVEEQAAERGEFSKLAQAAEWLRAKLADGPVPVTDLEATAKALGLAWRTVRRAQRDNGIVAEKAGVWRWRMPA
jgi:putative DNA primase/helicase